MSSDAPTPDSSVGASSPAASGSSPSTDAGSGRQFGFGSAVGWTVLGTVIPGLGLLRAGRKVYGSIALAVTVAVLAAAGYVALGGRTRLTTLALDPNFLTGLAVALLVLALGWVFLIGLTHLALRPKHPSLGQRAAGAGLVTLLSLVVSVPMAVGAQYSYTTAQFLMTVFGPDNTPSASGQPSPTATDPFAGRDRINVMVIGGDSGTNRDPSLGLRADSVMVASIDPRNGATTMFSLPRQTARIPFPPSSPLHSYYPNGFYDGKSGANAEFFLNAMYNNIPRRIPHDLLGSNVKNLGAEVMKVGVAYALGLDKIDYYVIVNMDGFKEFINAIGGVTLNVNYRIPIGGKSSEHIPPTDWIEVGPNQHMDGRHALWYARGRYSLDDYSRMERQRCVINAVVEQAQPDVVLTRFNSIVAAGQKIIMTDVPRSTLPSLVDLALKVKNTQLHSVVFKPGIIGWVSANPPWTAVRKRVQQAIAETEASVAASATPTPTPSTSGSPSAKPTKKPGKTDDLSDACAYHPAKYKKK